MKFNTFLFRDLDNNIILVKPDPETKELDFHVVEQGVLPAHELPLNQVHAVEVTEPQEDEFILKGLFRLAVVNSEDLEVDLAPLADEDEESFRTIVTRLYDLINLRCSMPIQSV